MIYVFAIKYRLIYKNININTFETYSVVYNIHITLKNNVIVEIYLESHIYILHTVLFVSRTTQKGVS